MESHFSYMQKRFDFCVGWFLCWCCVSSWLQLSVTVFFFLPHRWPKAIGSGVVSQSKWTAPFSQASMACGTCMSLLWCSCMLHPIRTMGMTSPMVSFILFTTALFWISKLLSLQDLNIKGSGFPNQTFPPSVNDHSRDSGAIRQKTSMRRIIL